MSLICLVDRDKGPTNLSKLNTTVESDVEFLADSRTEKPLLESSVSFRLFNWIGVHTCLINIIKSLYKIEWNNKSINLHKMTVYHCFQLNLQDLLVPRRRLRRTQWHKISIHSVPRYRKVHRSERLLAHHRKVTSDWLVTGTSASWIVSFSNTVVF